MFCKGDRVRLPKDPNKELGTVINITDKCIVVLWDKNGPALADPNGTYYYPEDLVLE